MTLTVLLTNCTRLDFDSFDPTTSTFALPISNMKHGTNDPVITVKTSKSNTYTHEVKINGPSKVIYSPDKPLSCGAKVWIETESEVITI